MAFPSRRERALSLPQDLFAPRHYGAVRRDVLDATTLPPWCYTAPNFFDREVDRIFGRCWNFIGHAGRIPAAGDYFTLEYAGVPLIVIRDRKGVLRAFANTCRHRGSRLLEGAGNCRAIKCPYHGWIYGLDGELRGTSDMERTRDFDKSDYGLIPVRLELGRLHIHEFRSVRTEPRGISGRSAGQVGAL